jgi:hypothetical protein
MFLILLCKVYIQFLKSQIWKEFIFILNGKHIYKCEHISQLMFLNQNLLYVIHMKILW